MIRHQDSSLQRIQAYYPEARGRSARTFRTLQDRLPNELALAGITEVATANRSLAERFLPAYNQRGGVGPPRAAMLCGQEERVVANDSTVHDHRQRLQIPQDQHRFHAVKVTVRVHAYPDGTVAVFHGPRCLARYDAEGRLIETESRSQKDSTPRSSRRPIVVLRPTVRDIISAHR